MSLLLACPMTSQAKGYPFEVRLDGMAGLSGAILVDHLRSLDWRGRQAQRIGSVPEAVLDDVLVRLRPLLGL